MKISVLALPALLAIAIAAPVELLASPNELVERQGGAVASGCSGRGHAGWDHKRAPNGLTERQTGGGDAAPPRSCGGRWRTKRQATDGQQGSGSGDNKPGGSQAGKGNRHWP